MAVYTKVTRSALNHFLCDYPIAPLRTFEGIAEGYENTNYILETEEARYILTLFEKRTNAKDLPFFLTLMDHMAQHSIPCPRPVKTKNNIYIQKLNGKNACITSFLNGTSVTQPNEVHCAKMGETIAAFHVAGSSFSMRRNSEFSLKILQKISDKLSEKIDGTKENYRSVIEEEMRFLEASIDKNLPKGIIHGDFFPDNVLFGDDTITGLLDFYFATYDFLTLDLAVVLNAWCFDENNQFIMENATALLHNYKAIRPLSADEWAAFPTLCRLASLRFLLTRLYDTINPVNGLVPANKNPIEYLQKLAFHQRIKDAAQYVI